MRNQQSKHDVQGCTIAVAQSRYARMHKDSHTKPLHDATAQMAVIAQMQRHKWLSMHRCNGTNGCRCTDVATQTADEAVMRNQQSKHDVHGCTIAVAQSRRKDAPTPTTAFRQPRHTFANSTSGVLFLVMGRRDGGVTIPPSWRQKSLRY